MHRRVFAIGVPLLLAACAGQGARGSRGPSVQESGPANYYALAHGAQWHYSGHLAVGGQSQQVNVVALISRVGEGEEYELGWRVRGDDAGTDRLRLTSEAVLVRAPGPGGAPAWAPILRAPVAPGTRWTWSGDGLSLTGEVLRRESVTTPAGRFDAVVVEVTQVTAGSPPLVSTRWLAAGTGIVKFVRPYARGGDVGELTGELAAVRYTRG